jgi:sialate O-acetylesterase
MQKRIFFSLVFLSCSIMLMSTTLKLPRIFSDGMVLQQQSDVKIWGWGKPKQNISVTTSWNDKKYNVVVNSDSVWAVKISTPQAAYKPHTITIVADGNPLVLRDVLIGEVWLCSGQSNMHMPMKGYFGQPVTGSMEDILSSENENLRYYNVKQNSSLEPQTQCEGVWEKAGIQTTGKFSATAYYFGRLLQKTLNIPVGLIHASWGGSKIEAWMSKESLAAFPEIKIPTEAPEKRVAPLRSTVIYNGMISPIAGYSIKGVVWYQGEASQRDYKIYPELFKTMHKDWIQKWDMGKVFPVYFCQITPYAHYTSKSAALMREAQMKIAQQQEHTAMAVLLDVGEENILHCANKKAPGERLAYIALARDYGYDMVPYRSPEFKSVNAMDNKLIIRFKYAEDGLSTFGKDLKNFEIAGADKVFYPAKAQIVLNSVELSCDKIERPVAVRYAFKEYVEACLFGINGLPVSSFRSDNWDDVK